MSRATSQGARCSSATASALASGSRTGGEHAGSIQIDIAEVQTSEGKLYLFVGIDRTAKFAVAQRVATADRKTAWGFLQHLLEAVPYQVHTILTDSGLQFAEQPRNRNTIYSRPMRFDMICAANRIEHRLTKPITAGAVQRRKCTVKNCLVSPRAFLRTNGRNALDMARDFDRQVAEFQVRPVVLNGYTALGIPVTTAPG